MLGTGSWGKELGGGSIDIDFNLLSGSWEVRVARFFLRWRLDEGVVLLRFLWRGFRAFP